MVFTVLERLFIFFYFLYFRDMKQFSKHDIRLKIHLIISIIIVVPVSFIYGFDPNSQFDIVPNSLDEHNFLKAIMGLYLGFSALWVLGIFHSKFLKTALISNMIFMLGLGLGRIVSVLMDGIPTFAYVFGTIAELFLGFYGIWILTKKNTNFAKN